MLHRASLAVVAALTAASAFGCGGPTQPGDAQPPDAREAATPADGARDATPDAPAIDAPADAQDVAADSAPPDDAVDAPASDAPADSAADAPSDSAASDAADGGADDAPPIDALPADAPLDAADSGAFDAPLDATPDVVFDAPADALPDAALDATPDAIADAPADAPADAAPDGSAGCPFAAGDPRRESVETRCDGIDNDCDGLTDVLLPVAANACTAAGACAPGWAACVAGARVCYAPPPLPEVSDGVDNDCNGAIDDVPATTATVHPRALVLVPPYLWDDGPGEIDTVVSILEQRGVPYDAPPRTVTPDAALATLDNYSLVIVPGYLEGTGGAATYREQLEAFARRGGVVVVTKPVGDATEVPLQLTGLLSATRHLDVTRVRFDAAALPVPTASFDSPEERDLLINATIDPDAIEVYDLAPDPAAGTTAVAHAFAGAAPAGVAITRRPLGRGAVYALGHDLHSYAHYRCYINCFEPAGDMLGLFFRDALRESAGGHLVLEHVLPGAQDSALMMTHDVDAPDAQNDGVWGTAGAIQMATMEARYAARGTYNVTTDYVADYWNPMMATQLCTLGMCPLGAHSVRHLSPFDRQPLGTCTETRATYPAISTTLCGEIRVSRELLVGAVARPVRVWRSPFLEVHPSLFDVLASEGFVADSSYAVGDFKTSLPIDAATVGYNQDLFHHRAVYEFEINLEDGIGTVDAMGTTGRIELQTSNLPLFVSNWTYAALRNAGNQTLTTALIHPSYGVGDGIGPSNLANKIAAGDAILAVARDAGLQLDQSTETMADFWRGRAGASVDATYDTAAGYRGTLRVGAVAVTGYTLEFGDQIATFTCAACGPATIRGRRVVLTGALAAGTTASFTAVPR